MQVELEQLTEKIRNSIRNYAITNDIKDDELRSLIESTVAEQTAGRYISLSERLEMTERIFSSIRGLGLLDEIIGDESI